MQIPTHVFDGYYAEISIDLTEQERTAFTTIFATIKSLNSDREVLIDLYRECRTDGSRLDAFSHVVDNTYIRASIALIQGKLLWELKKNVPVEKDANWDEKIVKELADLKQLGGQRTKAEIERTSRF